MNKKVVDVAVGVIKRGEQVFICKRHQNQHQGGKWEFPGGKIESGEGVGDALARELFEEVGIQVSCSFPLMEINHDYSDKSVSLKIHIVEEFSGEPTGQEGQLGQWVNITQLQRFEFPEANKPIYKRLQQLDS